MKHLLLAICLMGMSFAYAQDAEIICDIPDPEGNCYTPLSEGDGEYFTGTTIDADITGINFGVPFFAVVGISGAIAGILIYKKMRHN